MIASKIACIGNMNNNMFNIVRYLRLNGYDATLFLLEDEKEHFHPSKDSFCDSYKNYTVELPWGNAYKLNQFSPDEIRSAIDGYDFFIGCGTAAAYLNKAGIDMDIFVPYGSDFYSAPFFKLVHPKRILKRIVFSSLQSKGILRAKCILIDSSNEIFEQPFKKLNYQGVRLNNGVPMIFFPEYSPEKISKYCGEMSSFKIMDELRSRKKLLIFHHSRHVWKSLSDPISVKRNDRLLRALSELVHKHHLKDIHLITLEYGEDVSSSKELIKELAIEEHVTWLPKMSRKELMAGIMKSDIVAGEFNMSWFSYGVVYEAMVASKPILHYREDSLYKEQYPEMYPMLNAKEVDEIVDRLIESYKNRANMLKIGKSANQWFRQYVVDEPIRVISKLIDTKVQETRQ
ncbi:glycosyltransferase [Pleionea sp. CnH1-48]|uniref:glycosyltransferase n=1 Tax=Pleionea sp. CnH1-48 TaxID=2954494 RepID=UPI002097C907|nr:glycosyltransferase [Pleionea sp. CnH1-48]MCO7223796.1 hypothetical protein [Pleionea sp. CnH1-48]